MKKEFELVNLEDYIPQTNSFYCNTYYLQWFELMRFGEEKYVWFGVGQWSSHIMDWRGCNFWHSRLPKSPIFVDFKEAIDWLYFQVEANVYSDGMELRGHHMGDARCPVCNKKEEDSIWDRRETNVVVYHHYISGARKIRKSRLAVYKENLTNL